MADIAHVQFAEKSVWVGENYTSRDDMRNALYSRAKVSQLDSSLPESPIGEPSADSRGWKD